MNILRWLFDDRQPPQPVVSAPNWDEIVNTVARCQHWPPVPDSVMARLKSAVAAADTPDKKVRAAEVILRGWSGAPQSIVEDDMWWYA